MIRLLILLMLSTSLYAQEKERVLEIDLRQSCEEEKEKKAALLGPCNEAASFPSSDILSSEIKSMLLIVDDDNQKESACDAIKTLAARETPPIIISKKDDEGNIWKIKFYFGFTRTDYANTDMHLKTSDMDIVIKDFEFEERTSASYYRLPDLNKLEDSLRWIDEPTNTFTLSLEKNKNTFYLTVFHPKFLKKTDQQKQVTGTLDGSPIDSKIDLEKDLGWSYFGNTYRQLDWQIGYGRKFTLLDNGKGVLSYTPRVDAGISTGLNLSKFRGEEKVDGNGRIMGANGSLGHRLEFEKGRYHVFVDQKFTMSHLKHGFMDGTAEYNMKYHHVTVGVGITLFSVKRTPARVKPELSGN